LGINLGPFSAFDKGASIFFDQLRGMPGLPSPDAAATLGNRLSAGHPLYEIIGRRYRSSSLS